MKKYLNIILVTLLLVGTVCSCKKSTVWIQSFDTGAQSTYDKNGGGFYTQAIRSF